jgi:hypothetical protein
MSFRTCDHLKADGVPCGSPALRGKKLCYYHLRDHQRQQYLDRILRALDPLRTSAPLPKTLSGVQAMLREVFDALAYDRIHPRRATKLLFALQQHSVSLRKSVN